MNNVKDETHYNFKGLFKYISTVVSWTIFVLLIIVGVLLIYYYISVRLYATKGEKFEPEFSVYTIVSESMEPTLSKFDVIVITKVDDIDDVKINDVITFVSTWNVTYGMTITHRVVGTKTLDNGEKCLVTRGDNNTQEDSTCVEKSNLIGVTKAVIPGLGKIQFFLSSSIGWLLVILIPALYVIIKDVVKIFNLFKDIKKEENNKNDDKNNKEKNIKNSNDELLNNSDEIAKLEEAYNELKKVKDEKR